MFLAALSVSIGLTLVDRGMAGESVGRAHVNVLFIVVDDLRPELGCYGHSQIKSPNIDSLAACGMLFERAYCQQAVCAPSRASLLSGCRPDTTKIYDLQTPLLKTMPDVVTLPQLFRKAGYVTVSLGKVYHHANDDPKGWAEVDRVEDRGARYLLKANNDILKKKRDAARTKGDKIRYYHGCANATECAEAKDTDYRDGMIAQAALEKLRQHQGRPFFLAVGFHRPHLPFAAPKRYWDLYRREAIAPPDPRQPAGMPEVAWDNFGELRAYADIPKQDLLPPDKTRELIHGYYASVSYTDALIGQLLAELDRLKLRDRTVIVLWGDHGWKLGEYGGWCKHTNFEYDTHAPLILSAPGFRVEQKTRALVEFVDVYPTLADLCGLDVPEHCEGVSLVPLLRDPQRAWKTAVFSQYPRTNNVMGYSLRTDRYRYTEWIKQDTGAVVARELYDHAAGPFARINLAATPESPDIVRQLSAQMKAGWNGALPTLK
jgi:iduronate 2-sulfatase